MNATKTGSYAGRDCSVFLLRKELVSGQVIDRNDDKLSETRSSARNEKTQSIHSHTQFARFARVFVFLSVSLPLHLDWSDRISIALNNGPETKLRETLASFNSSTHVRCSVPNTV